MKKYSLVTTLYCTNCLCPDKEELKNQFNYDGNIEDLYINFSNRFDPWNKTNINAGASGRKDLVYGKIFLLKDFIKDNILGQYEYICHIDFNDTKFAKSFLEMMNTFESSNQEFIIATEKTCWPYLDKVKEWTKKELPIKDFYYLNSGCIISKTEVLLNYLDKLSELCLDSNIDFWDDQGVWQYYDIVINKLHKDYLCEYFFCTALLDNTFYSIDNKIIKTKFDTYPYIIHDNSSFNLNLISQI